jgi:hypothetical protein
MRVHLQDTTNRLYYTGQYSPPGGFELAMNFGSVGGAAEAALEERLTGMEIVVRYEIVPGEIRLPILAEWCALRVNQTETRKPVISLPRSHCSAGRE